MKFLEVAAEDVASGGFVDSGGVERGGLGVENRLVPAAGEETRVGAEEQALRTRYGESAAKDRSQIETFVLHPAIAAAGIEPDVRAQIGEHQRFPERARAKVRHDEMYLRKPQSDRMEIERVSVPHVEL